MEKELLNIISDVFNVLKEDIKDLKRFEQGMSNYTFHFKLNDKKYVIRKIGLKAYKYVDYNNEYKVLKLINDKNITSNLIYYNVDDGLKISTYIKGNTNNTLKQSLIDTLKKLHGIKPVNINDYNLIERLNKYESYNDKSIIKDKYYNLKNEFLTYYEKVLSKNDKVLCHNDLQHINIINYEHQTYFIDFEYSAINDPLYDFASYEGDSFLLYEMYYNKKISLLNKTNILYYKMYQSLQWYQVATFKEKIGFSKLTNYNFKDLANYFINQAINIFKEIKEINNDNK